MSVNLSCFTNIIGLSRTACNCFPGKPAGTDVSLSNLFLDEQEGVFLDAVNALRDCQSGNLWEHMLWAREEATNMYIMELKNCMELNANRALPQFSGTIGNEPFTKNENIAAVWAGQAWALANKRGAKIKIKRVGAAFNQTSVAGLTLLIKDDLNAAPLFTIPLNTTQDTMYWNTVSGIEIPMHTVSKDCKYLYFIYQLPVGWLPKEMNASCGCGNMGIVNIWCGGNGCKPNFKPADNGDTRYDWLKWLLITGIKTQENPVTATTNLQPDWNLKGLIMDVDITCETDSALCPESGLNFSADPLALVHAYAIRYKSSALLYSRLLSTSNISRFTTKNREYMADKVVEWNTEFQQRLLYVCNQSVDRKNINRYNDCLSCKEAFPIRKQQILK